MEEVKVIGVSPSLFCVRIEWALMLKGVKYEYIEEDLSKKSNLLLQSNPVHKKVPVLLHNGKPISESLVILEYIEDTWKNNPLLPADPVDRAMVRFWAKYIDDECVVSAVAAYRAQGHEKEKAVESAQQKLGVLNEQIQNNKLFGETMSFLDLVLGSLPHWLQFIEEVGGIKLLDPQKFPSLYEWTQKFAETPLLKERMPSKDDLINYLQATQKKA